MVNVSLEKMKEALKKTDGNVVRAGKLLRLPSSTIYRKFIRETGHTVAVWYEKFLKEREQELLLKTDVLISEIQKRGYFVEKEAQSTDYMFKPDLKPFDGDIYRFGLISDTHMCSKYQQLTHLHTFYEIMHNRGISSILHAGDILAGEHVYRGQVYEIFMHGADEQIDYAIRHYPEYSDIKTYFICGNHDESFYKHGGHDVGKVISKERKDMIHLGFHGAYIELDGTKRLIYLHHGKGSVAYARSYKQQKIIEQFTPDMKPHIHLLGHFHTMNTLWSYRNVFSQMLPCFETQTPNLRRSNLYPEVGGMVIEFRIVDGKPTLPKVELIPFYVHMEKDY